MSSNIFLSTAPAYFAANIPVIPLFSQEKRPIPQGWNRFADEMPGVEEQQAWLDQYPDGNIGLVLGKCSRVSVMDIDTDDQKLINMIIKELPESPWVRVGKKGMVIAFRYNGVKTFRIKTADGKSVCEYLSDRTQVVLPPSIHPDTKRPYTANCELLDVYEKLPECPKDLEERLRAGLEKEGLKLSSSGWSRVTEFVAPGMRDINLTEKAGLFAYAVLRGERTLKEAVGMLESYNEEFVQNVAGDPVDVQKHVRNLVGFLRRDVMEKKKILPESWDEGLSEEDKQRLGCDFTADMEEWRLDQILEFLRTEFERDGGKGDIAMAAVEKILLKMGSSKNLTELDKDRIMSYMTKTGQVGVTVAGLRRHLKKLNEAETMQGTNHSEIARAFIEDLQALHPVCYGAGKFWKYNGAYWEQLQDGRLQAMISENYGHMAACRKHGDIKGIRQLVADLLPQGLPELGSDVMTINFANGVLVMTRAGSFRLEEHSPDFGLTYVLPFRYIESEERDLLKTAPMFAKFLEDCWGADRDYAEKVKALQEMLAVTLFGQGSQFQRVFLLHGVPASGKSQLLRIVQMMLPEEAKSAINPADWNDRFAPVGMHKKLLNIAGELSDKRRIDGQRFKDIVDGSDIMGQYKGQDVFRMSITCTHWFAANHLPKTEDTSEGFTRRWLVLDFRKSVAEKDRRAGFGDEIGALEREAIAAWAVLGMVRLLGNNTYTLPATHSELVNEMANLNNIVRAFIVGCREIVVGQGGEVAEMKLYELFWAYNLAVTQQRALPVPEFRAKMRELAMAYGMDVRTTPEGKTMYGGVKIGKR